MRHGLAVGRPVHPLEGSCRTLAVRSSRSGGTVTRHGAAHLRPRERVRGHVHAPRPAPAQPRRGRPLPVPPGRVVGPQLQRVPGQRRPAVPRRRLPPRVRHARVRLDLRPRRARQGGGADPRAAARLAPSSASREEGIRGVIYLFKNNTDSAGNCYGCHENYLTSRRDDLGPLRRGAHPVPRQPPDLRRRRQGAADGAGRDVLHRPAGRAHLGGRVVGHHPQPPDHQHPRRAPRRRRALPAPPRHRRRLQHERVRDLPQGRRHRRSCCACSRTRASCCGT